MSDEPTPGTWTIGAIDPPSQHGNWSDNGGVRIDAPDCEQICYVWNKSKRIPVGGKQEDGPEFGSDNAQADARIICEAVSVFRETGVRPREAADELTRLRARVAELESQVATKDTHVVFAVEQYSKACERLVALEADNAALRAGLLPWRPISECPDTGDSVIALMLVENGYFEIREMIACEAAASPANYWMPAKDFPLPGQAVGAAVADADLLAEMEDLAKGLDHHDYGHGQELRGYVERVRAMLSAAPQPPAAEGEI